MRNSIRFLNANLRGVFGSQTTGEGNSKKVAKKHAAESMLNELKKLPPVHRATADQSARRKNVGGKRIATNSRQQVQQFSGRRKTAATPITEVGTSSVNVSVLSTESASDELDSNNPIVALTRIQQAEKQPQPVYTMTDVRGTGRRKEFVMEVKYNGLTGVGTGVSKKMAKREAAKHLLAQLSEDGAGPEPPTSQTDKARKVTFSEARGYSEAQSVGGTGGRQIVPGLLHMKITENSKSKFNGL